MIERLAKPLRKLGARPLGAALQVAGRVLLDDGQIRDIRIALASVAPTVLRCFNTEAVLRNHAMNPTMIALARTELSREISPIDDLRSTARYRRRVALNLLEEFLLALGPQPLTPAR